MVLDLARTSFVHTREILQNDGAQQLPPREKCTTMKKTQLVGISVPAVIALNDLEMVRTERAVKHYIIAANLGEVELMAKLKELL